jgi:hypothetical protein
VHWWHLAPLKLLSSCTEHWPRRPAGGAKHWLSFATVELADLAHAKVKGDDTRIPRISRACVRHHRRIG